MAFNKTTYEENLANIDKEKSSKFSVVIDENIADKLDDYVREYKVLNGEEYTKLKLIRKCVTELLTNVENEPIISNKKDSFPDFEKDKNLKSFRVTVDVPESVYNRLEDYLREYNYITERKSTKSDFVREAFSDFFDVQPQLKESSKRKM